MRIAVPHHTSKDAARQRVESRLGQLLGQFGHHAEDLSHEWSGDTLRFRGRARGFAIEGTLEVTASEVIVEAKLPLIARPFEPRIRHAIEREAEQIFRG